MKCQGFLYNCNFSCNFLTKGRNTRGDKSQQHVAATRRSNKFHRANRRILSKILSPRQNFVTGSRGTKSNHQMSKRSHQAICRCNLSLQMSAYDMPLDCTHKTICYRNVLRRFVASCVPALRFFPFDGC